LVFFKDAGLKNRKINTQIPGSKQILKKIGKIGVLP